MKTEKSAESTSQVFSTVRFELPAISVNTYPALSSFRTAFRILAKSFAFCVADRSLDPEAHNPFEFPEALMALLRISVFGTR